MNSREKGACGNGESSTSPRAEKQVEDGPSPRSPVLKERMMRTRKNSRDTMPVLSPRIGLTKRQSLLVRENSIDLDSPRTHPLRTPRNTHALVIQHQQGSIGPVLSEVRMSSVDLDEVEVFRSGPQTDREEFETDVIEDEELIFSASDLASGESIVFSAHIRPDFAEEHLPLDCGGCDELEIRVKALEHQIDALRAAVDAACAARKLGSGRDKKKSWTDRIFGCDADPEEERKKLVCEMEPLLKAVNFMFRKVDEVTAKCKDLN